MKFDDSTIAKNISVATEFFKAYQAIKLNMPDVKYPGGTTGFIPFNIEFTVDGISGIKIYDKLVVDTSFLPVNYTDTTEFIITGVNHSLKDGDWETTIKTTLIPKFDETSKTITAQNSNIVTYKTPPTKSTSSLSPLNITSEDGPADGVYISPPAKASNVGEYVDVSKTLADSTLKKLAQLNGGIYPIKFYTKPGDNSGTKYGKVTNFNGSRNMYEKNPAFSKNFESWKYTGKDGTFTQRASVNKLWIPTMTQIAQALDDAGMWNANHIKSWDPGIVYRDATPGNVDYGRISAHAFGMAIDINSGEYQVGQNGVAEWNKDFNNGVPTALVHNLINEKFVKTQGGTEKVFWLNTSDIMHFSVAYKI